MRKLIIFGFLSFIILLSLYIPVFVISNKLRWRTVYKISTDKILMSYFEVKENNKINTFPGFDGKDPYPGWDYYKNITHKSLYYYKNPFMFGTIDSVLPVSYSKELTIN